MASIPLPALAVKTDQTNPLDTYAKGVALQGLLANQQQQQQMRPLQLQEAQNQLQQQQLQLNEAKRHEALIQATNEAYQQGTTIDPNSGQPTINRAVVTQHLAQVGQGSAIPEVNKYLDAFDKSHADTQKAQTEAQQAQLDHLANMAHAVKAAGYDPIIAASFLGYMGQTPGPFQQQAQQTLQHIQQDPNSIKPFIDQIEAASEKQRLAGAAETRANAAQQNADNKENAPEKQPQRDDKAISIMSKPQDQWTPEDAAYMKGYNQYVQMNKVQPGVARMEILGNMREYPGIDPNTLQPTYQTPNQIKAAQAAGGAGIMPGGIAEKSMQRTALIEDIRGGAQQVRDSLNSLSDDEFNMKDRALIAGALKSRDPRGAITQLIGGQFKGALNDKQQEYLINIANLTENSMAMRAVLGAGQGSEDLRSAILNTIPGASTPNRKYALTQLGTFEKTLNRLERGIPNVPLRPQGNTQQTGSGTWKVPNDAPPAPQEDNHTLKKDGVPIAVSKGGKWVQP